MILREARIGTPQVVVDRYSQALEHVRQAVTPAGGGWVLLADLPPLEGCPMRILKTAAFELSLAGELERKGGKVRKVLQSIL
jgi:hypothetical protein